MMRILRLAVLAVMVGCRPSPLVLPIVGIDIQKIGQDYVFLFRNCHEQKARIGIHSITVKKVQARGDRDGDLYCELDEMPRGEELTEKWTYGATPPGYRTIRCQPLKPNEMYRVSVSGAGGGVAVFTTDKNGGVQLLNGNCN